MLISEIHVIRNMLHLPSLRRLCIVGILCYLSLSRFGVLEKCTFLVMELAEHAYRRVFLEYASTLSLPLFGDFHNQPLRLGSRSIVSHQ